MERRKHHANKSKNLGRVRSDFSALANSIASSRLAQRVYSDDRSFETIQFGFPNFAVGLRVHARFLFKVHGRNRRAFGFDCFYMRVLLREIRFGKDVETRYRIERSRKSRSKIRRLRHQVFVLIVVFDISIPFGHGSSIFQLQRRWRRQSLYSILDRNVLPRRQI